MTIRATMQRNDVTVELLQRLARLRVAAQARVLLLYLHLDRWENLATSAARRSAATALIDAVERRVQREAAGLEHVPRMQLRADIAHVRELLGRGAFAGGLAEGAHAPAVFACRRAGLLEALRLPRPVTVRVSVDRWPALQALAESGPARRWAVLLTTRAERAARLLGRQA